MAPDPMAGSRLSARGIPITLGGKRYRVILTFEAVELLESDFDGFELFIEHLRAPKYKASRRRTIRKGIVASLVHSKPADQDLLDFEREILDLLQPREMVTYLDALWAAIMEAFPPLKAGESPKSSRLPWEWLYYIATVRLGRSHGEFWRMTMAQFATLIETDVQRAEPEGSEADWAMLAALPMGG